MPIDTQWFFEIFLAGFVTVWVFRYFTNNDKKYAEFEWFALSAFWGIFVIGIVGSIPHIQDQLKDIFANPFATGTAMSFFGAIVGYSGSRILRFKWFKWLLNYLGKTGGDKSGKIF